MPNSKSLDRSPSLVSPDVGAGDVFFMHKVQYCAQRAERASDREMREHWKVAAEAWHAAAELIERANVLIARWEGARRHDELPRPKRPRPIISPSCDNCGKTMQFVGVEPHPDYTNLYYRIFTCPCGALADQLAMRSN